MQIIQQIGPLKQTIQLYKSNQQQIAFVPTMGNLHRGHIELIKRARQEIGDGIVVVSIFVNPLQFDDADDLAKYPRTLEQDIAQLETLVDVVFCPDVSDIQGNEPLQTRIVCGDLAKQWEGAQRPGHFDGMATVVAQLFQLVQADIAIFGQKDFQQLSIIRQMVKDFHFPIKIISHPIVREANGLAMSSRNARLSEEQRQLAGNLYTCLQKLTEQLNQSDMSKHEQLLQQQRQHLSEMGFALDYLALVDGNTLLRVQADSKEKVILVAARLGGVRLLDNMIL